MPPFGRPTAGVAEETHGRWAPVVGNCAESGRRCGSGRALFFGPELSREKGGNHDAFHLLGIRSARRTRDGPPEPLVARSSQWVRAPQSGILRTIVPLGAQVNRKEVIGWVSDPFGKEELPVKASASGIVIGRTNLPLVHEGEALFHIARFRQPDSAAESVEYFQEQNDPSYDSGSTMDEPPIL